MRNGYPRGAIIGLLAGLLTSALMQILLLGNQIAAAQNEPTPTPRATEVPSTPSPTLTSTPLPSLQLRILVELMEAGDLDRDRQADPGDTLQYTIQVANSGISETGPLEVALNYDSAFIGAMTAVSNDGQVDSGDVVWQVQSLAPGDERTLSGVAQLNRRFRPGRTQVIAVAVARAGSVEFARAVAPTIDILGPNLRITDVAFELVTDANENGRIDPGDSIHNLL